MVALFLVVDFLRIELYKVYSLSLYYIYTINNLIMGKFFAMKPTSRLQLQVANSKNERIEYNINYFNCILLSGRETNAC